MIDEIVRRTPFFLLVFARCFSLLVTLPLFSMRSVSRIAKLALAFYMAYFNFLPEWLENKYKMQNCSVKLIEDNTDFGFIYGGEK